MQGPIGHNGERLANSKVKTNNNFFTYELVLAHVIPQTSYHEGTLGSVEELYYEETGKDGFFKYMSAPLAR